MRRWFLWFPVVMVGSLFYWTVALGLGGLSLMAVSAVSSGLPEPMELNVSSSIPIVVHLEESAEPEDVNDNVGCGYPGEAQPYVDEAAADAASGPGQTAF